MKCPHCKEETRVILVTTLSVTRYNPITAINANFGEEGPVIWGLDYAGGDEIDGDVEEEFYQCESCGKKLTSAEVVRAYEKR
jgi:hypothetical protein